MKINSGSDRNEIVVGAVTAPEFTVMVRDFLKLADQMIANKMAPRPITLDDVAHAKLIFDGYIKVKAQRWYMGELAKRQGEAELQTD
jgi:hypothetical protein